MSYHIDADKVGLDDLDARISNTDLVPSRASLIDDLSEKIGVLKDQKINTLAELRSAVKTTKRLETLSAATGIAKDYLVLLRREIESYFPKPLPLNRFTWLPSEEIEKLEGIGIRDTGAFYETFNCAGDRDGPVSSKHVHKEVFEELARLSDLARIQWTGPTAARMYVDAGYESVEKVASADADRFHDALVRINEGGRYFKGKIGLRDIKRLIYSAGFLE